MKKQTNTVFALMFVRSVHDYDIFDNFGGLYRTRREAKAMVRREMADKEHCLVCYGSKRLTEDEHYAIREMFLP